MQYAKISAKPIMLLLLMNLILFEKNVEASINDIDLNLNTNIYLFNISDMAPGDWMPRDITIKNDGKQDFRYIAKIGKSKSFKGLFEELELIVKKDTTMLFEGKLKDFNGFTPRELGTGTEETLFFQVTMPYELGNEFQGSSAEVEIIFLAEGTDEADSGNDNETPAPGDSKNPGGGFNDSPPSSDATVSPKMVNKLPNTATDTFNLLIVGAISVLGGGIYYLIKKIKLVDIEK